MKNFVYVLIISLMILNPVFLLAKHNFTKPDNMPSIEEIVEFQLSILDEVDASFDQAEQLENGNYQMASFDLAIIASILGFIFRNGQHFDNYARFAYSISDYSLILNRHLTDIGLTNYRNLIHIRQALQDIPYQHGSNYAYGNFIGGDDKRMFDLPASSITDRDVVVSIQFGNGESRVVINHPEHFDIINNASVKPPIKTDELVIFSAEGDRTLFTHVVRQPAEFVPTLLKALKSIAVPTAATVAIASLLFANDAEAGENGQIETVPVEITPEDFEQMQNDIDAARDSLFSFL